MKKALYINIGGEGHLNPTLGLVHDLVQRGDNIVYYSSNDFEEKIKKAGAQFRPILKSTYYTSFMLWKELLIPFLKKSPKKHTITSSMMHSLYLENGLLTIEV
ncbi:hypothetical protein P4388_12725 [Bacillus thuringiensis]|uniref:hypothetical protein n=1 Tax=Bacillus cereus group TaxID=86661 RepID=UPI0020CB9B8A|nr:MULTISPECIES: hypothetical protein [Bacillus cereus group]MED3349475.1 hypothetical protein [Bacillus thuringiensis]